MRVRVLGELEVEVDGAVVELGGPKPRALVGLLAAAGGRPVPVEHLIDQIWGEATPARVEASLQSYVARLRRVLGGSTSCAPVWGRGRSSPPSISTTCGWG